MIFLPIDSPLPIDIIGKSSVLRSYAGSSDDFPQSIYHSKATSPENRRCCLGNKRFAARRIPFCVLRHTNNPERTFCRHAIRHRKVLGVTLADYTHVAGTIH
jgi:hypothetical protein